MDRTIATHPRANTLRPSAWDTILLNCLMYKPIAMLLAMHRTLPLTLNAVGIVANVIVRALAQ